MKNQQNSNFPWNEINMKSTATGLEPKTTQFLNELSGCEFESSCSHLNFRFRACFEQFLQLPWHSGNYVQEYTMKSITYSRLTLYQVKKNIIYIYDVTIIDDKVMQ